MGLGSEIGYEGKVIFIYCLKLYNNCDNMTDVIVDSYIGKNNREIYNILKLLV